VGQFPLVYVCGVKEDQTKSKISDAELLEFSQEALVQRLSQGKNRKYVRFLIAALGSIPWIGGFIAATASLAAEREQQGINDLQQVWLQEHKEKIIELRDALNEIFYRLDNFGDQIQDRIESTEYLALVRKAFRSWDEADTKDKKQMLKRLIMNAGAIQLCDDDLVRLFLHWVELYHETHFVVVRAIYRSHRITRGQLWSEIRGKPKPRENSYEADLFKYLIRDLSTGGVIRQERQTDGYGNFVKKESPGHRQPAANVMKSAFDDTDYYVLTDLGAKFVHYVMEDVAPQLGSNSTADPKPS
jgi:hypothetical protein